MCIRDRPGIITGVILAIGRIVGESAALLFTAGSGYLLPKAGGWLSKILQPGGTLTIQLYLSSSKAEYNVAFGIAFVLLVIVLCINFLTKYLAKRCLLYTSQEALVETIGCSGMTHSAAMAAEILPGLTVMEALNTDLVCDAINTAMRELFLQIVYGRSQSAFSEDGLAVGAGLEDLGKGLRSQVGTMYGTLKKGPRYLEMAEGYVTGIALDADDLIIGYQFVNLGKMTDFIKKGDDPNTARCV